MSDFSAGAPGWRGGWLNRLVARPGFQSWASRFPLTRRQARRDGEALFDLVQGFVQSQVLMALVELDVLSSLRGGPLDVATLARRSDIAPERMRVLMQAASGLGLCRRRRNGHYALARKGAALLGVPGLAAMIRHHKAFYADLADPVALLRSPAETELARFWPYVFGAGGATDPETAATYSDLMAQSQRLVAEDTLRAVSLKGVKRLLDVGGGTGAFLEAVGAKYPDLDLTLFDLPAVVPGAEARFAAAGLSRRTQVIAGSFRDQPLPPGHDAISLVRVLYDHDDKTVAALLGAAFAALPAGGRLVISEPMGGGARPHRAGDVYFAFYTMAMQTGRVRAPEEIRKLCTSAGFTDVKSPAPARGFVTRTLTARKLG